MPTYQNRAAATLDSQKILYQLLPFIGQHALGMKLHPFYRELAMPQTHDGACPIALGGVGTYFPIGWEGFLFDNQGVVTRRRHGGRQPAEDGLAVVLHRAGLAMHQVRRTHNLPAKRRADGLMSQADPEHRHFTRKMSD